MRRILVTGANKGIGRAIVEAILAEHADTFVYLGSRDLARGHEAAAALVREHPAWEARIEVVPLDVVDDASVSAASARVRASGETLYGLVNNAGIASGEGADLATILDVNVLGVHRVCEAFLPLLQSGGRIVNVTSASGPSFVAACTPERKAFFLDPAMTWPRLEAFVAESIANPEGEAYGLSKACANSYTLVLAREHPALRVNACTPGFIETDLTRHFVVGQGKTAAELGLKPPSAGARAPMFLLFGEPEGNGHFYGSDAQRSPLDRYRSPGSAPYVGD